MIINNYDRQESGKEEIYPDADVGNRDIHIKVDTSKASEIGYGDKLEYELVVTDANGNKEVLPGELYVDYDPL